ncbi:hypothetical protein D3C71_1819050 [compost metagenome]
MPVMVDRIRSIGPITARRRKTMEAAMRNSVTAAAAISREFSVAAEDSMSLTAASSPLRRSLRTCSMVERSRSISWSMLSATASNCSIMAFPADGPPST